jgi:isopenicillin N synthase-like dioxygenase
MIPSINPYTVTLDDFQKIFTVGEDRTGINSAMLVDCLSDDDKANLDAWWANQQEYFKLDLETKEKHAYSLLHHVGYERYNLDRFFTERFYYYTSRMEHVGWPKELNRDLAMKCVAIKDRISLRILEILDEIVGGTQLVDSQRNQPLNTSGILYYPAYDGPVYRRSIRHDIHADYNLITLFFQEPGETESTCFQIRDQAGKWHDTPRTPYGICLCFSNLLEYWSNTYFKCTPHHVTNEAIEYKRYINTHYIMPSIGTVLEPLLDYKVGEDIVMENRQIYGGDPFTIPATEPRMVIDSFSPARAINKGWRG